MIEPAHIIDLVYEKFRHCGSVSTDSRRITPGSVFFALKGGNFDGNAFVETALAQGAAFAVADDPRAARLARDKFKDRVILVGDALSALQQTAARHRYECGFPVLAITGTNGKTTTKELTARVLSAKFAVGVTQGNLNNHIGVPLTLLSMGKGTEFAVVEMGAGAPGEIALLCRIAQPDFGIITNIGLAHLEGFGNIEGVRRGKGELYDYLAAHGGVAFCRRDDPTLTEMAGERPGLRATFYESSQGDMPNRLEGDYNRFNIAAAAAIGEYFGVAAEKITQAVEGYSPDNNRSQTVITKTNRLTVDCYNANPSSMAAALENFAAVRDGRYPGKLAILGDMLELGEASASQHAYIIGMAGDPAIGQVWLVGPNFRRAAIESGADRGGNFHIFENAAAVAARLAANPPEGKHILIKGSRGMKLETLTALL